MCELLFLFIYFFHFFFLHSSRTRIRSHLARLLRVGAWRAGRHAPPFSSQVVDYDIDAYAGRLEQILDRKAELIVTLKDKLKSFRAQLQAEENASQRVQQMPQY